MQIRSWIFIIGIFSVALFSSAASAVQQQMTYLPRDQEIDSMIDTYSGYLLQSQDCNVIDSLNSKAESCQACVQARNSCPDCCLNFSSGRSQSMQCSQGLPEKQDLPFIPDENCREVQKCTDDAWKSYVPSSSCSGSKANEGMGCQKLGCLGVNVKTPSEVQAKPKRKDYHGSHQDRCQSGDLVNGQRRWLCNKDSLDEPDTDVAPCSPTSSTLDIACYNGEDSPFVVEEVTCPHDVEWDECYEYKFTDTVMACVNRCLAQSLAAETYEKASRCCMDQTCPSMDPPGSQNCSEEVCAQRIAWPECANGAKAELCCDNPALNTAACLGYQNQIQACMDDVSTGKCVECFQRLGPANREFKYEFFARSNEKIMIIAQMAMEPRYIRKDLSPGCLGKFLNTGAPPNTYFYMMVKVFDITDGNQEEEVFPLVSGREVIAQNSFTNAFSVYFSTLVDKDGEGVRFLRPGRRYKVNLFWYIPVLQEFCLSANVSGVQLNVIRLRN